MTVKITAWPKELTNNVPIAHVSVSHLEQKNEQVLFMALNMVRRNLLSLSHTNEL